MQYWLSSKKFWILTMGYLSCNAESVICTADSLASTSTSSSIKIQEFNYKDLELATNNFSDTKLLGRGSHGLVYKGVLRGGRLVAVKKPSRTAQTAQHFENPNEVENEIEILSKLQNPRLVNIVGFTNNDSQDRLLVVEFMSNGTLYDVLHSNSRPLSWGRRIKLALQTAKAIDSLHSLTPPVIHRDIKSSNVLIDRNFSARLGDFGLALRCVDDYKLRSTPPAGTMGYLDPSYVTPDNLSTKTDVFSFGILLLEIISGRKAIDVSHSPPCIVDWAIPLIRRGKWLSIYDPKIAPPKDPSVRKLLAVVATKCVRPCRERRPSMKDVVQCFSGLSKLVPDHSWNGFVNPCLMVESVGRPVQSRGVVNPCLMVESVGRPVQPRGVQVNSRRMGGENGGVNNRDAKDATLFNIPGRVCSELGFGSNLMELMAGPKGESSFRNEDDGLGPKMESTKQFPSFRLDSKRFVGGATVRTMVLGDNKDEDSSLKGN